MNILSLKGVRSEIRNTGAPVLGGLFAIAMAGVFTVALCSTDIHVQSGSAKPRVDGWVRPGCVEKDIHLVDCDFSKSPARCKKILVEFNEKCVRIEVVKE